MQIPLEKYIGKVNHHNFVRSKNSFCQKLKSLSASDFASAFQKITTYNKKDQVCHLKVKSPKPLLQTTTQVDVLPDNNEPLDDQLNFDDSLLSDDGSFEELEPPSKRPKN